MSELKRNVFVGDGLTQIFRGLAEKQSETEGSDSEVRVEWKIEPVFIW